MIDVREKDEWTEGFIPGARWIPRGFLELRIEDQVPERRRRSILYCAGGTRSALAARALDGARLHQRQVDGRRVHGVEARRDTVRQAVHHDAGAESALRAAHHAAGDRARRAGEAAEGEGAVPGRGRAGLVGGHLSGRRRRGHARASSTTTWSMRRTCSGRSCTPPTASASRRWSRRARPSTASIPT